MLNVDKIKFNMNLWKDIETFPTFHELYKLSGDYYKNCLNYVLCDKDKALFIISLQFNVKKVIIETNYFFMKEKIRSAIYMTHNVILSKYNFTKNFQSFCHDFYFDDGCYQIVKYAFIPDLYQMILNTINI